jgi:uncharacterized membrane protein YphA (DoxX/SURF4 family)
MDIALWIAQVLLAVGFVAAGVNHYRGDDRGQAGMAWMRALPTWQLKTIGVLEVLGAVGLILPAVTRIAPWLVWLAAFGLALVMVSAIIFHVARREWANIVANAVLGAVAAFVFIGRLALAPLGG